MRKISLLALALCLFFCPENLLAQYQLVNGDFEHWDGANTTEPTSAWNGFPSGQCDLTGIDYLGCGIAKSRRHSRETSTPDGSNYCLRLFSTKSFGIIANGNMTTGRIRLRSKTPTDPGNYNFSKRDDSKHCQVFNQRPDSVKYWGKVIAADQANTKARISIVLHDDSDYKDPSTDSATAARIGHAQLNFACSHTGWVEYMIPFVYFNSTTPSYVLVSLTTNSKPGGGAEGDEAWFDNIRFVYNKRLQDLQVNNVTIPGFDPNQIDYTYYYCHGTTMPSVTSAIKQSQNAGDPVINVSSNITTVSITHGGETMTYTVTFVELPAIDLPTVTHMERCGAGSITLHASPGANANTCRWYSSESSNDVITEGITYSPTLHASTTFYVSSYNSTYNCETSRTPITVTIHPVPETPVVSDESRCGDGDILLSASVGTNGTICRWYSDPMGTHIAEGASYNALALTQTSSFYVSSYNETTSCEGPKEEVKAIVYPVYNHSFDVSACDEFTWAGETFTSSGSHSHTFESIHGCDSNVVMNFTINYTQTKTIRDTICSNKPYTKYDFDIRSHVLGDTEHNRTIHTIAGCDSIINLYLFVKESVETTESVEVCSSKLPYHYHGTDYTTSGIYPIILTAANGCDSTIQLHFTVLQSPGVPTVTSASNCGPGTIELTATLGANASNCHWYDSEESNSPLATGTSYSAHFDATTTVYVSSYRSSNQCESPRIPIQAIIHPIPGKPTVTSPISRCGSGTLDLEATPGTDGNTCRWYYPASLLTSTGLTYTTHSLTNSRNYFISSYNTETGCESVKDTIPVTINPVPATPACSDMSDCGEGSFSITPGNISGKNSCYWYDNPACHVPIADSTTFNTPLLNESKKYYAVAYDTVTLCQSTSKEICITLHPEYTDEEFSAVGCASYKWNDSIYNESGRYVQTFKTANNCDSVVTLNLTIVDPIFHEITESACVSYLWNDSVYTQSGDYTQTFVTENLADSTVTLHLTIYPAYSRTIDSTVCDSIVWYGETLTTSNAYSKTFTSQHGCDSIEHLNLTVHHSVTNEFSMTACDSYKWNDIVYNTSGDHIQTLFTSNGCDSIVTLHLTINSSKTTPIADEICQGGTYSDFGFSVDAANAGIFTHAQPLRTESGCDSIVTLTLTVHPTFKADTAEIQICTSASYDFFGTVLTSEGTYQHTATTQYGCDSIVTLKLTVGDKYIINEHAEICEGSSYFFAGNYYTQTGVYRDSVSAGNGCDSITILHLTVHNPDIVVFYDTLCQTAQYNKHDFDLTIEGLTGDHYYDKNLLNRFECDSSVSLYLYIKPIQTTTLPPVSACDSYTWNGTIYTSSGNHQQTFSSTNGCDSIVTLPLTIHSTIYIDTTVCNSFTWEDSTFTTSGSYPILTEGPNGCEKSVLINLTVHYSASTELHDTICQGEIYNNYGFLITPDELAPGYNRKELHIQTGEQCDSLVILHLEVHPVSTTTYTDSVCQTALYENYGFTLTNLVAGTTTHVRTVLNGNECSDTIKLTLTVYPQYEPTPKTVTICASELPYQYGDSIFHSAGNYTIPLQTGFGCDSNIMLSLQVNPVYYDTTFSTICEGSFKEFEGEFYGESGTYSETYSSHSGCDSIRTLVLTVNPTYVKNDTLTVCSNDLPTEYAGEVITGQGNKVIRLQTELGCDSTINLRVNVTPAYEGSDEITICESETPFQYGDSLFSTSGTYQIIFMSQNGCDSTIALTLTVNPVYEEEFSHITCSQYTWNDSTYTSSGDYIQSFKSQHNCDSTVTLHLTIHYPSVVIFEDTICQGESYTLHGFSVPAQNVAGDFTFTNDGQNVNQCDSTTILKLHVSPAATHQFAATECESYTWNDSVYTQSGSYQQSFYTGNRCDSIVTLELTILQPAQHTIIENSCGSFDWYDSIYTASGSYTHTLTASNGCDSIITLQLTIYPVAEYNHFDTICLGEPYVGFGFTLPVQNEPGVFVSTRDTVNAHECDELIILNLLVAPSHDIIQNKSACDAYVWNDSVYTTSGTYSQSFISSFGCDSTVTVNLIVSYSSEPVYIRDTICLGDTYEEGLFSATPSAIGTYRDSITLRNQARCDSIIYLELFVNPTYFIRITDTTTVGESYEKYGFNISSAVLGIMRDTLFLSTEVGCDSTVQLVLFVFKPDNITDYNQDSFNVNIYPNPTSHIFTVESETVIKNLEIHDMNGRIIRRIDGINKRKEECEVTGMKSGIYFIRIITDKGAATKKLIVQ